MMPPAMSGLRATRGPDSGGQYWNEWPSQRLGSHLEAAATEAPESLAVVDGVHELSYRELFQRVCRVAGELARMGVQPGDVVTVVLPNWWETLVLIQAALRLGAVVNPIVPIYRDREIEFICREATPKIVFVPHMFRGFDYPEMMGRVETELCKPITVVVVRSGGSLPAGRVAFDELVAARDAGNAVMSISPAAEPEQLALLMYTSGTTASPKGVLHSHQTLGYENESLIELFGLGERDTVFMPSPLTHITGFLYGALLPPRLRAASVLLDIWEPARALELVEKWRCRFTVAATPFLDGLTVAYGHRGLPSSLTRFLCGGADVPPDLVYRARRVLGADVQRVYGSSEFPTFSAAKPADPPEVGAETDGRPIGPVDWRLDGADGGVGELLVRGPELFLGYLDPTLNGEAFTDDGFFRTGDRVSVDSRGAITVKGRDKDIIIRNGENISAREIEDLLQEHEMVRNVAVVAMPDDITGEKACAFVVPADGTAVTMEELSRHLETRHIARQKVPEWLELVEELPTTASGKVQKYLLRQRAREIAESSNKLDPPRRRR
jgi:cyclohexanecarboxylate-CoA ligase